MHLSFSFEKELEIIQKTLRKRDGDET